MSEKTKTEIISKTTDNLSVQQQDPVLYAIQQGAPVEQLEKMMELKERYEANEAKKAFVKAMTEFKKEPIEIIKNKKVGYEGKKGGTVGYSYADLGNVVEIITQKLSEHGLSVHWTNGQEGANIKVTCHITHELGHSESTFMVAPPDNSGNKNPIQAIGSTTTYLQRYTLFSITGVAAKELGIEDDDGVGSSQKYSPDHKMMFDLMVDTEDYLGFYLLMRRIGIEAYTSLCGAYYKTAPKGKKGEHKDHISEMVSIGEDTYKEIIEAIDTDDPLRLMENIDEDIKDETKHLLYKSLTKEQQEKFLALVKLTTKE